jgi:hypothetical protein
MVAVAKVMVDSVSNPLPGFGRAGRDDGAVPTRTEGGECVSLSHFLCAARHQTSCGQVVASNPPRQQGRSRDGGDSKSRFVRQRNPGGYAREGVRQRPARSPCFCGRRGATSTASRGVPTLPSGILAKWSCCNQPRPERSFTLVASRPLPALAGRTFTATATHGDGYRFDGAAQRAACAEPS